MYVPFRIRKFMLRCWQSIEVPICFRWLDKTVEPWRSMTVSLNEFLLGHLKVLWNEPRQKKYKVHTGFWYVCSNIYIHTVPYISTYVNLMKQFQQYIYIYTFQISQKKKNIPFLKKNPLHFHRTLGGRIYLCPPRWCNMRTSRSLCCPPYSLMSWTSGSPTGVKHPCENLSLGWGKHHVCGETTTGV